MGKTFRQHYYDDFETQKDTLKRRRAVKRAKKIKRRIRRDEQTNTEKD